MKSKAMILSLALVGLLALPIVSLAQGAGKSGSTLDPSDSSSVSLTDRGTTLLGGITLSDPGTIHVNGGDSGAGGSGGGALPNVTPDTPEPGAIALLVGGVCGGLVAFRRRKK